MRTLSLGALVLAFALVAFGCAEAQPACDNTCHDPGVEQTCAGGIATCKRFSDGCMYFSQALPCPQGEICQMNADGTASCVGQCPSECDLDSTICAGNVIMTCTATEEGCNEYMAGVACQQDERCDGGVCVDNAIPCEDECATSGETSCSGNAIRECGQFDNDECLDLGAPILCGSGELCETGACVATCEAECPSAGARTCESGEGANAYKTCISVDGCLLWGEVEYCESGDRCDGGDCVQDTAACTDECESMGLRCVEGAVVECGDFDTDDCLDERPPVLCDATTQICEAGACVARPIPTVVISELIYNSPGSDVDPGNNLFIELAGTAGASLEGMSLVGVNGSNGDDYQQIALSGTIPSRGYYLIAHPDGDTSLTAIADLTHNNVNLQNGSSADQPHADAVQLRLGDNVVDAVGYGLGSNTFGEGGAAEDVGDEGMSLSRDANNTDTDNNNTDFTASTPSPGAAGGA